MPDFKIDKIRNHIEDGNIKIPPFQRGFVWDKDQICSFLDSIYRDFPVGSILLWNSKENLKSRRSIGGFLLPEKETEWPVNYVLDGQQRLTALYGVFCRDRRQDQNNDANIDPHLFDIFFDLIDDRFVHADELDEGHANLKMSTLFDVGKFHKEVNRLKAPYKKKAEKVQYQFSNYEVPIIVTEKQEKDQVGRIFERINNTGEKLTLLDLMVAWTWSEDFHLKEEINDIRESLASKGFEDTDDKILLQCIAAVIRQTTKTRDIMNLDPKAVRESIPKVRRSIEKAVDFLATEFNISSGDFLPHSHQIVPLTFFFSAVKHAGTAQRNILKKWFWRTAFSRRYAGSTDQKMNDDIEFFAEAARNRFEGIDKYDYEIDEPMLLSQPFSKSNPFARAFLLLLAQKNPLNLVTGGKIDLGSALSKYNKKEYHHVFPREFLKKKGYDTRLINVIGNICFLPSGSNKVISKKAPSEYVFQVIPSAEMTNILKSNLLPTDRRIYRKDAYKEFLKERVRLILRYHSELISD